MSIFLPNFYFSKKYLILSFLIGVISTGVLRSTEALSAPISSSPITASSQVSLSISVGGTSQTALAKNVNRANCLIQNQSIEQCTISFGSTTASLTTYQLPPSTIFYCTTLGTLIDLINVNCPTTGSKLFIVEFIQSGS